MIADLLEDEESKFIWTSRKKYNETQDIRYIHQMCYEVYQRKTGSSFKKILYRIHQDKKLVLFGCGAIGKELCGMIQTEGITIDFFCDNNAKMYGNYLMNVPIIEPNELKNYVNEAYVLIATSIPTYIEQIKNELYLMGFSEKEILFSSEIFGRQYFGFEYLNLTENEIFIDGGCYNGDDSMEFMRLCNNRFERIIAFEPGKEHYEKCCNILGKEERIQVMPYGLWNQNAYLPFSDGRGGSSCVTTKNGDRVEGVSLDNYLEGNRATFIKMDIEGSELKALEGAKKTIKTWRPKLAICVYHKPEDIYEIPNFIKSLDFSYRLYMRHYAMGNLETVLYAV